VLSAEQVAIVNEWIRVCQVGWIECRSAAEAILLEEALLGEAQPPLNRR
jgi:hypothetical protein